MWGDFNSQVSRVLSNQSSCLWNVLSWKILIKANRLKPIDYELSSAIPNSLLSISGLLFLLHQLGICFMSTLYFHRLPLTMANTDVIRMSRDINLLSACSIMTGVIIGSGIFISPVSLINNCGSVAMSLLMWVFSGFLSLCIALCFTELAGMFPRSGGEYAFYR